MKIHDTKPKLIIRLTISQREEETAYISFTETTHKEVIDKMTLLIGSLDTKTNEDKIRVDIREQKGGKNGTSRSLSFTGFSPKEFKELLIEKYK